MFSTVLKISMFSVSSSYDPVIRMLHYLFIVFEISVFSKSSFHDPLIRMFHYLFIVLKILMFSISSSLPYFDLRPGQIRMKVGESLAVTNCHRGHFKLHTEKIRMSVLTMLSLQ